jgi:GAF domain-containing protein
MLAFARRLRDRGGAMIATPDEPAAPRRAATMVAEGVPPEELYGAITAEAGALLDAQLAIIVRHEPDGTVRPLATWSARGDPSPLPDCVAIDEGDMLDRVAKSLAPVRVEDWSAERGQIAEIIRELGGRSSVGAPILVDGRLWGSLAVHSDRASLSPDTDARIGNWAQLLASAMANVRARAEIQRLADEQAALRRVATLVAEESSPAEVFALIVEELGQLLEADLTRICRYEADGSAIVVAAQGAFQDTIAVGTRLALDGRTVGAIVRSTERPSRIDHFSTVTGPFGALLREGGVQSAVGTPIVVDGRLWGVMVVATRSPEPLIANTEARVQAFCELVATAISNSEARHEVKRLADEQAALRRVATLVAQEVPLAVVFSKVAEELATLLGMDRTLILRYDDDGTTATPVASWGISPGSGFRVGMRLPLQGETIAALVLRTGQPARIDDYSTAHGPIALLAREQGVAAGVASPIIVRGRLWGATVAASCEPGPLPSDTESRVGQFTELVATAIGNAEARSDVARLADEQAALRRVATLVAKGSAPTVLFDAVTAEVAELLRADHVGLARFEAGGELTMLAHRGRRAAHVPDGTRLPLDDDMVSAKVLRTGQSVRVDLDDAGRSVATTAWQIASTTVGTPIVVDGRLWGSMTVGWIGAGRATSDAELRLTEFAALLDVAIANADSRAQLTASRARMVAAGDDARRRVVRDLHDGAQQRLVHTIVTLKLTLQALDDGSADAKELVAEALEHAHHSNVELRELVRGILPAALTRGGLRDGIGALVSGLDLPVTLDLPAERFSRVVEASAYFVVAEALTNVLKHAQAQQATVRASVDDGMLNIEVCDDGIGGANPAGNGLVGIEDRVSALGGRLWIESAAGGGTVVSARLPTSENREHTHSAPR